MNTIEHLAVVNLRLAQKCAKKDDFIEGMKRTVSAHIAKSSEMGRQRDAAQLDRFHAEAALAHAERRLRDANNDRLYHCAYCGETGDMSAIADHSKVCAKHPMREVERQRDAEKARADALQTAYNEARAIADKAEREVERMKLRLAERDAAWMKADSAAVAAVRAEVERLQVAIGKEHTDNERLRGIIGRALDRLSDILCGPDDKCRIDGSPADRAIVDDALRELREADAPTVPSGFPGNLLREADAPPAKPRRMKANAAGQTPAAQKETP